MSHRRAKNMGFAAAEDCPDARRLHTKCPQGYLAWHEWAERQSATQEQWRCPTCGFLSIWKPKTI